MTLGVPGKNPGTPGVCVRRDDGAFRSGARRSSFQRLLGVSIEWLRRRPERTLLRQ
jgi:hypothetical protein